MKNLAILGFSVTRDSLSTKSYTVDFTFSCDQGNGSCSGYCCESADAVMVCVKQLLNNEWPS